MLSGSDIRHGLSMGWTRAKAAGKPANDGKLNIAFITPALFYKRNPIYWLGGKLYGQTNAITGPLVLGGILKSAGHHVEVYEELHGFVNYKRLLAWADVLCLYTMTSTSPRAYELGDLFHEKGHARVLIGGIHASAMPEEALAHADQVIVGEGEQVILDVVEGRRTEPIVKAEPVEDLDTIPFPDYSILKTPCMAANVISSRGCPYRCTFCTTSRMFSPYRKRSIDNVMDEIRLYHDMGFKYMNFEDDNFTADKERAKEICRRIIAEHLQFKETFFFGRTDMAEDEELLDLLAQAHLTRVLIGIESLNQSALDAIHKGQDIEDIRRAAEACRAHGIRVIASIVLGLDEDSRADIRRSVDFAKSVDAYQIQPAILTPYPGTPVFKKFQEEGRLLESNSWGLFDMMNVTFQPKQMSPWDLQDAFLDALQSFYTFDSAKHIGDLFGSEYAWRRFYYACCAVAGPPVVRFASNHIKISPYYALKQTPWMFDPNAVEDENAAAAGAAARGGAAAGAAARGGAAAGAVAHVGYGPKAVDGAYFTAPAASGDGTRGGRGFVLKGMPDAGSSRVDAERKTRIRVAAVVAADVVGGVALARRRHARLVA